MKLYKYILSSTISLGLLISSCSNWLDVTPADNRTTENFYTTPSQMEQALMGIYNGLFPLAEYSLLMSEVRGDNTWCGEDAPAQRDYMDISSFNPNIAMINTVNNAWVDLFEIVSRANMFLSKVDGVEYTIEGLKEQQIGEARFLRALAYFDLVRYYGRVPLTLVPQTITEAMATSQSEAIDVYNEAILPDLEYAIKNLTNDPMDYLGKGAKPGRATLTAAKALLGKVYLTMAGFPLYDEAKKDLARQLLEEVIDYADETGKYWAKDADAWKRIWIHENDNKYHIFEIQYVSVKGYGNPIVNQVTPGLPSEYVSIKLEGHVGCSKGLDDLLKKEQDAEGHLLDVRCLATIDTTKFINDDDPNSITKYGGDDFFIKFLEHKMKRQALGYGDISSQIIDYSYFPTNFPIIRLEDVMLMYAEIVGPTTKGVAMVNRIRSRAGVASLTAAEKEADKFQECVADERRKELALEGIRWHDLVRHNTYRQAVIDKFNAYAYDANGSLIRPKLLQYVNQVTEGTYLFPIPDAQMKVKDGLYTQNEAYR